MVQIVRLDSSFFLCRVLARSTFAGSAIRIVIHLLCSPGLYKVRL